MQRDPNTGVLDVAPGYLSEQLHALSRIQGSGLPSYDLVEWPELLDSSNVGPAEWSRMAAHIGERYFDYDGFVVLHGTDTMGYSASVLSFLLQNLGKPVIFTGSQVPFCDVHSDGRRNMLTSMVTAANLDIPEVGIFFNDKLLRGNRAVKTHTYALDAFESPNFPPLGQLGVGMQTRQDLVLPPARGRFKAHTALATGVTVVRLAPGFDDNAIMALAESLSDGQVGQVGGDGQEGEELAAANDQHRRSLVVMLYGTGGSPDKKEEMFRALRTATDNGAIVAVCSQCMHGSVDLNKYAVGAAWANAGVVSAGDMTVEAVVGKLGYLMARSDLSRDQMKNAFLANIRGEREKSQNNDGEDWHWLV
eukprot:g2315.t1